MHDCGLVLVKYASALGILKDCFVFQLTESADGWIWLLIFRSDAILCLCLCANENAFALFYQKEIRFGGELERSYAQCAVVEANAIASPSAPRSGQTYINKMNKQIIKINQVWI